jgi:hypothetical protein
LISTGEPYDLSAVSQLNWPFFGMAGVLIIFRFGAPQPTHQTGVGIGVEDSTVLPDGRTASQNDRDIQQIRRRYLFMSQIGLVMVFAGFVFQLCATWS